MITQETSEELCTLSAENIGAYIRKARQLQGFAGAAGLSVKKLSKL